MGSCMGGGYQEAAASLLGNSSRGACWLAQVMLLQTLQLGGDLSMHVLTYCDTAPWPPQQRAPPALGGTGAGCRVSCVSQR